MKLLVYLEENNDIKYGKCHSQHEIQYVRIKQMFQETVIYICIGLFIVKALTKLKPVFSSTSDS